MKQFINIALVQLDVVWENPQKNHQNIEIELSKLHNCDLALLPEMFNSGFSQNREIAQTMDGYTVNWMKACAQQYGFAIAGTLAIIEKDCYYNRLVWIFPNGEISTYDKHILFEFGNEKKLFSAGKNKKTISYLGWNFQVQICYELRFPLWTSNTYVDEQYKYDALIYLSNWPSSRLGIWDTLLAARAIENQSYVIGVNRVGKDTSLLTYGGKSQCCFADGEKMSILADEVATTTITLDYEKLKKYRNHFPFAKDWEYQI